MKVLKVEFLVQDPVFIIPLKAAGVIIEICVTMGGLWYKVRYFDNMDPKEVFFLEWELLAPGTPGHNSQTPKKMNL